jgi:hypothetical protein
MARTRLTVENVEGPPPSNDQHVLPPPVGPEGLRLGSATRGVSVLQLRIGCPVTGQFDQMTDFVVRRMQDEMKMEVNGVATAAFNHRLGLPYPPLDS